MAEIKNLLEKAIRGDPEAQNQLFALLENMKPVAEIKNLVEKAVRGDPEAKNQLSALLDKKLLEKAIGGDRDAQNQLFEKIKPELQKIVAGWFRRYQTGERVRTTEILDTVFLKLIRAKPDEEAARHQFNDLKHFYAFAYKNAQQVLIDVLRKQDRVRTSEVTGQSAEQALSEIAPRGKGLSFNSLEALHDALEELEEVTSLGRWIVQLRFWDGYTWDEIAAITGEPRTTAVDEFHVALGFLKDCLGPSFPEFGRIATP